jgi:chemotaxis protein MotB
MAISRAKKKEATQPIRIRRIRRAVAARPRGAWKIAYADFVTALMAFFLLMWLTAAVSQEDRQAIAEYFRTPLEVVFSGGQSNDAESSMIVAQYGEDKTKEAGQVGKGEQPPKPAVLSGEDAKRLARLEEEARLLDMKQALEQVIAADPELGRLRNQLRIDLTTEGLRIQVIDEMQRPMFELGEATLQPYASKLLRTIGGVVDRLPNGIGLSGHTDAATYRGFGAGYSNWELSMDRANASRRELVAGGMDPEKIRRVVGLASSVLFNPADPYDPNNRRISIVVMKREAGQPEGEVMQ